MKMNLEQEALDGRMRVFSTVPKDKDRQDLEISLAKFLPKAERVLMKEHEDVLPFLSLKFQLSVQVQLKKYEYDETGESIPRYVDPYFVTDSAFFEENDDLSTLARQILVRFDTFINQGSGWLLD